MHSKVYSTHAQVLQACAIVELRFVTDRKKKFQNQAEFITRAFPSESPSNEENLMSYQSLRTSPREWVDSVMCHALTLRMSQIHI